MTRIEELRTRIEEERAAWQGKRWRCSWKLRGEIEAIGKELIADGWTAKRASEALGLGPATLGRWLSSDGSTASSPVGFRRVEIDAVARCSELRLVSPAGYRVEGLDLEQVKQLLPSIA